jgi:hypothetical protein
MHQAVRRRSCPRFQRAGGSRPHLAAVPWWLDSRRPPRGALELEDAAERAYRRPLSPVPGGTSLAGIAGAAGFTNVREKEEH